MAKSLFNFYLDDTDKIRAIDKLNRLCGEQNKGQLAALLRVYVKGVVNTPDDKISPALLNAIANEYEYS